MAFQAQTNKNAKLFIAGEPIITVAEGTVITVEMERGTIGEVAVTFSGQTKRGTMNKADYDALDALPRARGVAPVAGSLEMLNTIIDTYSQNSIDFVKVKAAGIVAVIHKATEGATFCDSKYQDRRARAKELGFLWGAYHFSTGVDVADQVENFLKFTKPTDDELISLDWESSNGPDMTLAQARDFVQMIKNETGRFPVIYGGHLLRDSVGHDLDPILSNCPLWYARYAVAPIGIPTQIWPTYTLWQYTDGEHGPEPHDTAGVSGADRNIFQGTTAQLKEQWPFTRREDVVGHGPGFAAILGTGRARSS